MVSTQILIFKGHNHFRQRLMLATLTGKPVRIDEIRSTDEQQTGISGGISPLSWMNSWLTYWNLDYEASFLRLLEKLTNGCSIEISYTGAYTAWCLGARCDCEKKISQTTIKQVLLCSIALELLLAARSIMTVPYQGALATSLNPSLGSLPLPKFPFRSQWPESPMTMWMSRCV